MGNRPLSHTDPSGWGDTEEDEVVVDHNPPITPGEPIQLPVGNVGETAMPKVAPPRVNDGSAESNAEITIKCSQGGCEGIYGGQTPDGGREVTTSTGDRYVVEAVYPSSSTTDLIPTVVVGVYLRDDGSIVSSTPYWASPAQFNSQVAVMIGPPGVPVTVQMSRSQAVQFEHGVDDAKFRGLEVGPALAGGLEFLTARFFSIEVLGAETGLPALRAAYVAEVNELSDIAINSRVAGASAEDTARLVHSLRRELGEKYKALTPPDKLAEIYERNLERYGDRLGPTIEWLRAQGKSWEQIIESASRAGGKDLGF